MRELHVHGCVNDGSITMCMHGLPWAPLIMLYTLYTQHPRFPSPPD